jgi:hypothetical protein
MVLGCRRVSWKGDKEQERISSSGGGQGRRTGPLEGQRDLCGRERQLRELGPSSPPHFIPTLLVALHAFRCTTFSSSLVLFLIDYISLSSLQVVERDLFIHSFKSDLAASTLTTSTEGASSNLADIGDFAYTHRASTLVGVGAKDKKIVGTNILDCGASACFTGNASILCNVKAIKPMEIDRSCWWSAHLHGQNA